jgi:hypothetical protein
MRFLALLALLVPVYADAGFPAPAFTHVKTGIGGIAAGTDDYRIGDEWGKRPVTLESLQSARPAFRRAALATARVGGATGFYLGTFHGAHVMATNHHVFSYERACLGGRIRFPLLGVEGICEKFLGTWSDVDLALFTIRVSDADAAKLESVAANFLFGEDVRAGQNLLTIGFGVAGNSSRQAMANEDSDCYVFSDAGDYHFMADPDRWNPGSYRAWSFALGCDVSHGDSGSAIVDRESGSVVGIIWTGNIPKSPAAQSSQGLNEMFRNRSEGIWTELSYAVPAKKIGEYLRSIAGSLPQEKRDILEALLQ